MLADRKWYERENTLGCAFFINRGALGRPAALQAALREFGVLARDWHGQQVDACLLLVQRCRCAAAGAQRTIERERKSRIT